MTRRAGPSKPWVGWKEGGREEGREEEGEEAMHERGLGGGVQDNSLFMCSFCCGCC